MGESSGYRQGMEIAEAGSDSGKGEKAFLETGLRQREHSICLAQHREIVSVPVGILTDAAGKGFALNTIRTIRSHGAF